MKSAAPNQIEVRHRGKRVALIAVIIVVIGIMIAVFPSYMHYLDFKQVNALADGLHLERAGSIVSRENNTEALLEDPPECDITLKGTTYDKVVAYVVASGSQDKRVIIDPQTKNPVFVHGGGWDKQIFADGKATFNYGNEEINITSTGQLVKISVAY